MNRQITKWETSLSPAVAIEQTAQGAIAAFWGVIIPAIPDLLSVEQARTGMTYETALERLLAVQQRWIQQLHGDRRFSLSLRIISTGNTESDLILGLVGKSEGTNEPETIDAARNFFNKIRDTFPNGYYLLQSCQTLEDLYQLRLPFLPSQDGSLAEFRRELTSLNTISHPELPNQVGIQIDTWKADISDFQELLRALVSHPTPVAVAITLRPTQLTPKESKHIGELADAYSNIATITRTENSQSKVLSTGISYQEKIGDAESASKSWRKLLSEWRSPFEMTIGIMAESSLPQSVIAALQSSVTGRSPASIIPDRQTSKGIVVNAESEPQKMAARLNWLDLALYHWANTYDLDRLPWLYSPEEVHSVFRLPIADRNGVWGIPSSPKAGDARRLQQAQVEAEIEIGLLRLTKKQLTQHLLICGVPGSGKTNTSLYLLEKLWQQYRIPWMVLEPAKTEYRGLKSVSSLAENLLIFTLGDEKTAPFRFNPFEIPSGVNLDTHLGSLVDLFSVSMSMWGPLPNVIEQLIQEAYRRKGYTLLGDNYDLQAPQFSDLQSLIPEIVPKLGYKKESTDEITAAVSIRISKFCRGSLGKMLNVSTSIPFDFLMNQPVILEMSQVTNTDDRAFIMGLILNRCYQYWMSRRHEATGELKHLLLVEEAHNLLANAQESTNQEQANPKGKAVRNFANMLAEVRGFGQGIAIAEQNPSGLVPDVMVNTNIKIAHRIVEAKNRESIGQSMLLTSKQETDLAALKTGQMLYYIGGNPEPNRTIAPNFKDNPNITFNPRLTDAEIHKSFQSFKNNHAFLYSPPTGCPTDEHLSDCIERGINLAQIFINDPQYKEAKRDLILEILGVPFGINAKQLIYPTLAKVITGINHLKAEQIIATLNTAVSFIALEAIQEKGKVHGWLGSDVRLAHQILMESLLNPDPELKSKLRDRWVEICRIPDHLLQMGIPDPNYAKCEASGVFRYENKMLLQGDRTAFRKDMAKKIPAYNALTNWAKKIPAYRHLYLNPVEKHSLVICLAIQLTEKHPVDLPIFLTKFYE